MGTVDQLENQVNLDQWELLDDKVHQDHKGQLDDQDHKETMA